MVAAAAGVAVGAVAAGVGVDLHRMQQCGNGCHYVLAATFTGRSQEMILTRRRAIYWASVLKSTTSCSLMLSVTAIDVYALHLYHQPHGQLKTERLLQKRHDSLLATYARNSGMHIMQRMLRRGSYLVVQAMLVALAVAVVCNSSAVQGPAAYFLQVRS